MPRSNSGTEKRDGAEHDHRFSVLCFIFLCCGYISKSTFPTSLSLGTSCSEPSGLRRCLKNTPPRSATFPSSNISIHPPVDLDLLFCSHPTAGSSATHRCHVIAILPQPCRNGCKIISLALLKHYFSLFLTWFSLYWCFLFCFLTLFRSDTCETGGILYILYIY